MRRVVTFLAALGLVASLAAPNAAVAYSRPDYLALGDSLAFGFSPLLVPPNAPPPAEAGVFVGYPNTVAALLGLKLTNASCPGETSSHLIDLAGTDNGCGTWRFAYQFPLHATYVDAQLAFADAFLRAHPNTRLVTLDIGANDLHVLADSCGGEANVACITAGLPGLLGTLGTNLDTIYGHIRTADGYTGRIVALTIPALDYNDPVVTPVIAGMNQVVAAHTVAWGGIVADGFGAEKLASAASGGDTCAAGLRIRLSRSPLSCDDHPSPLGRLVLSLAVAKALLGK
jgi:lysophospholipase L1-like esterase